MLKDKVAIVTGAARGIGKEIALGMSRNGAKIVISDVLIEEAEKTAQEINSNNGEATAVKTDVSDESQTKELMKATKDKFGKIDILVNNAGITRDNLIMRMKKDEWDSVININLTGVFNCIKSVSRIMMRQKKGKIINIASIVGQVGNIGQVNYCAAKAGVIGITKTAARELAPRNINVNAIAPGFIKTPMTDNLPENVKDHMLKLIPLSKIGNPIDVAHTVCFLASDFSDYITGQVINVDGGLVMQ